MTRILPGMANLLSTEAYNIEQREAGDNQGTVGRGYDAGKDNDGLAYVFDEGSPAAGGDGAGAGDFTGSGGVSRESDDRGHGFPGACGVVCNAGGDMACA